MMRFASNRLPAMTHAIHAIFPCGMVCLSAVQFTPATITRLAIGVLVGAGLLAVTLLGLRAWKEARDLRRLKEARRLALIADDNLRRGLRTMATIVPGLGDSQLELSARAMELLDTQSALLIAVCGRGRRGRFGGRGRGARWRGACRKSRGWTRCSRDFSRRC